MSAGSGLYYTERTEKYRRDNLKLKLSFPNVLKPITFFFFELLDNGLHLQICNYVKQILELKSLLQSLKPAFLCFFFYTRFLREDL